MFALSDTALQYLVVSSFIATFVSAISVPRAGAAMPGSVLAGAPVNNITITPTNVVQCGSASISWTGATNPVDLSIGIGGFYVGTTPITTLSSLTTNTATWTVNQPSGTDLIFQIKDATGMVGYIQNIKVGSSPTGDSSCLGNTTSSSTGSSGSSWSPAAASPAGTTAGTTASSGGDGSSDDGDGSDTTEDDASASNAVTAPNTGSTTSSKISKSTTTTLSVTPLATISPLSISTSTSTTTSSFNSATLAAANSGAATPSKSSASDVRTRRVGGWMVVMVCGLAVLAL